MLLIYTGAYILGTLVYYLGHNIIASAVFVALAIFLFVIDFIDSKRIINIRGLFGISFIGGFGLSLLKLSNLSMKYSVMTFLVVFASYFSLYVGTYAAGKKDFSYLYANKNKYKSESSNKKIKDIIFVAILILTCVSFIAEIVILGFLPFLTHDTPHAYSTFHVYGLHYITTLYVFLPSIAVCNYFISIDKKLQIKEIIVSYIYVIILSVLMVSRSQLISSVVLSMFTFLIYKWEATFELFLKIKRKRLSMPKKKVIVGVILFLLFIGLYVVITISRAHNKEYLNGIFDMKNKNLPLFITQPYMYIAHNFENLNYMIENTFRLTFGRRTFYPLFTLTLIKKFFPIVTDSPIYVIKEELSTKTLVYDFYYDFGLAGIVVFCFIIGYIGKMIEETTYVRITDDGYKKNNYIVILFALFSYYMFFSFFQTYFSLTDTWVHIIFLSVIVLLFKIPKGKSNFKKDSTS